jgi:hypothetical protein
MHGVPVHDIATDSPNATFSMFPLISTECTSRETQRASSASVMPRFLAFFLEMGLNRSDQTFCIDVSESLTPTVEKRMDDSVTVSDFIFINYET